MRRCYPERAPGGVTAGQGSRGDGFSGNVTVTMGPSVFELRQHAVACACVLDSFGSVPSPSRLAGGWHLRERDRRVEEIGIDKTREVASQAIP